MTNKNPPQILWRLQRKNGKAKFRFITQFVVNLAATAFMVFFVFWMFEDTQSGGIDIVLTSIIFLAVAGFFLFRTLGLINLKDLYITSENLVARRRFGFDIIAPLGSFYITSDEHLLHYNRKTNSYERDSIRSITLVPFDENKPKIELLKECYNTNIDEIYDIIDPYISDCDELDCEEDSDD